jgi:hypothetical protein
MILSEKSINLKELDGPTFFTNQSIRKISCKNIPIIMNLTGAFLTNRKRANSPEDKKIILSTNESIDVIYFQVQH